MKIFKFLDKNFEEVFCALSLATIIVLLGIQVLLRFFFNTAFSWQEELTRILFVWFCYIGVSLGAKKLYHIKVTIFRDLLPKALRPIINVVSDFVWVFFNCYIVYISIEMLSTMRDFPHLSPAMDIDMFYLYLIIPISFTATTLRILQIYYKNIKNRHLGKNKLTDGEMPL